MLFAAAVVAAGLGFMEVEPDFGVMPIIGPDLWFLVSIGGLVYLLALERLPEGAQASAGTGL